MQAEAKIEHSNIGWDKTLRTLLSSVGDMEVAVGFPMNAEGLTTPTYPSNASILEVARWNNFGTVRCVPPRPFMQQSIPKIKEGVKAVSEGFSRDRKSSVKPLSRDGAMIILKELGLMGEDAIRHTIAYGDFVPNSPRTIRRKRSNKPLIDTQHMRQGVTYVIREARV